MYKVFQRPIVQTVHIVWSLLISQSVGKNSHANWKQTDLSYCLYGSYNFGLKDSNVIQLSVLSVCLCAVCYHFTCVLLRA